MKFMRKIFADSSLSLMSLVFFGLIVSGCIYFYMIIKLPDVGQLKDIHMQIPLHIYSADGKLIGEFGEKKRIPVTLDQVPKVLIDAVLDTEDQRFYEHKGVDFVSLMRAAKIVFLSGKKSQGASTITMQVARNFFFSPEKTYQRKINEILLAMKIDSLFSKKEILELYLNKIYLGQRAYGVGAAAQVYYGKTLNALTIPEMATLAGLPQAPSRDNPIVNPEAALERRNHVLERMLENNHISMAEYKVAVAAPIVTHPHNLPTEVAAPYVAEMVRNAMVAQYGDETYDNGFKVYTTIDSHLQNVANQSLRDGILAYDKRHGYRGPEKNLGSHDQSDWQAYLKEIINANGLYAAAVIASDDTMVRALLANGDTIKITGQNLTWGNRRVLGLKSGDVIRVQKDAAGQWQIAQLPKVEGALVALDPKNGGVLALVGGFSYAESNFNRVIQAGRQAGSGFKPFLYSAALEKGLTLATIVNDAPITFEDPTTHAIWQPQNDTQRFYGPTRLRVGLMESRNLVAVRLLQMIGVPYAADYVERFGFAHDEIPRLPSLALGTATLSPMKISVGFAVFANGGYKITPFFITKIENRDGKILFQAHPTTVPENNPEKNSVAPRVITPQNAYLMTSALKDVISYGTAKKAAVLKRSDLAGKTGTSDDQKDAWFTGFNGDLITTVWIGFDQPQTTYEHGSQAALPIWMQFMGEALAGKLEHSMVEPEGITTARIDPRTGLLAYPGQKNAIFEIFATDTMPKSASAVDVDEDGENAGNNQSEGVSMSPVTAATTPAPNIAAPVSAAQAASAKEENEPLF